MAANQQFDERRHGARVCGARGATPVALWQHHPVADQTSDTLADATCAFQDRFPCDLVKITPASGFQLRDLGQNDIWKGDFIGRREFGPNRITHPDDWHRLIESAPAKDHLAVHLRAARIIRSRIAGDIPVIQTIFDPLFQARTLAGSHWAAHREKSPTAVAHGLEFLTQRTCRLVEDFLDAGVDGVFLAVQHAGQQADPGGTYRDTGLPQSLRCLAAAGDASLNFVHLHGAGISADLLDAFPKTRVHFSFDENHALDDGRGAAAGTLLSGGMSPARLAAGSPQDVFDATRALIDRMAGRDFVLAPGCALYQATPRANVMAFLSAARDGGGDAAKA